VRDFERLVLPALPHRRVELERHGTDYGGWLVPTGLLAESSVVYSGGVGEDASFDLALIERYGCTVWAFDPTPRAADYAATIADRRFVFMPVGLWSSDSTQQFHAPERDEYVSHSIADLHGTGASFTARCRSVPSLASELGHGRIDLLKLDIEGAEHDVLPSLAAAGLAPSVICVELHDTGPLRRTRTLVRLLRSGYVVAGTDGWDITLISKAAVENQTK
jgi:FkbM family methyltransferase